MSRYHDDPAALAALVEPDQVHRDVYLDPQVFALEMDRVWARSWLFVGHDSQVPQAGDYVATSIATQPVVMVRHEEGSVRVLMNRCAHKGAMLVTQPSGNLGRFFRCPYHAWTFRTDGSLLSTPLKNGYEGTAFAQSAAARGLVPAGAVANYRGFVFARLSAEGPAFDAWFGDMLGVLDNVADRSPQGRLRVAGGILRSVFPANWKIYLENINDTVHPVSTHESAAAAAALMWADKPADAPKPMAMQQMLPFASGYRFFEEMGGRTLPNGHSILGTQFSIHTAYEGMAGYEAALQAAHGPQRAAAVLGFSPQNAVFYPGLAVKGSPQILRVLRPLAVDRTIVEAWAFQPEGAPEELLRRSVMYNRLVFSPMSVVAHDDLHLFQAIQQALRARGNDRISLHRGHRPGESPDAPADVGGTDERLVRNQFAAWRALIARP
jgi:nitrite reductase/ring-hydroxylating ferredoxin subunit